MRYARCLPCSRTVGWVSLVASTILMFMKAFVGLVAGSQAMLADALYSAKDVTNAAMAIVGMSISRRTLDEDHPFGHGKIEFILSLFLSVLFMSVTLFMMVHSIASLVDFEKHRTPHLIAFWAALVAIGVNVVLQRYSQCVAAETRSPLLRTLAKHHHSDATASAGVAIGIICSHYLNMPWIDPLVALVETVDLMLLSADVFWVAARGLMDRTVERPLKEVLARSAASTEGVDEVRMVRARHVGQEISAELVIGVDSELSVAQAHAIGEAVKENAVKALPRIGLISVSIKSKNDHAEQTDEIRTNWKRLTYGEKAATEKAGPS